MQLLGTKKRRKQAMQNKFYLGIITLLALF